MTTRTVPLEPTKEMIDAAFDTGIKLSCNDVDAIYKAMIEAAPAEPDPAADAKRWNALLNCARIRVIGKAGFERDQRAYRHIGLEIWTEHPEATKDKVKVQQWLTEFADQAAAISGRDAT